MIVRSQNRALHNPYDWYAELLELRVGESYSIVGAPVMAQILALPSFTGFVSALSGAGLAVRPRRTRRESVVLAGRRSAEKPSAMLMVDLRP